MSKRLNIILIILLSLCLCSSYEIHQENLNIKKGIILQFAFNQENITAALDYAIKNRNNSEKMIEHLRRAMSFIESNKFLAGNGTHIGKYSNIPHNLFIINFKSFSAYYAFDEALNNSLQEETVADLIEYYKKTEFISKELNRDKVRNMSLKELYILLDNISERLNNNP